MPGEPARLTVEVLEVLEAAPAPVLYDLVLERYGNYVAVFDTDRETVPVFTTMGTLVDTAHSPDAIGDLINTWENGGAR
ncbi:hypothetical protein ABZ650_22800 [Streptomyces griseoviridis]|uniref:hypothetical protein n=1 Tax=Streptomyces griseoviridis TaxID=45398 RepID=UPI003402F421